jgi:probable O-glycosylation ligase (exosortase A-associated)
MLRDLFVLAVLAVGVVSLIRGPLYALLLYLWLAYFRPERWVWHDWVTPLHLSLLVGTAAVLLTVLFIGTARIRWRLETTLLALFGAQSLLAAATAQSPVWAWTWWSDFARVLLIAYLITVHGTDTKRLRLILLVIALSLGFEAAKEGWVELLRHPGAPNMNPHPVLGDNNGVAMGMFMLAPILLALARTAGTRWEAWGHRFLFGGVLLRGFSTYSRGGLLAAAAMALMMLGKSRRRVHAAIALVLIGGATLSVMPDSFWQRMDTITASPAERDTSTESRLYFWQVALRMAADHPLTGVGFNCFEKVYHRWDSTGGAYGSNRAVHSSWFGALAETGYPGLLLMLLILLRAFWNCQVITRHPPPGEDGVVLRELAAALQAALVAFVVGGTFISEQYSEILWHFVGLTTAIAWTARELRAGAEVAVEEVPSGLESSALAWTHPVPY